MEGFLAQVLQSRQNHLTFRLFRVEAEERPDLFERFEIDRPPALLVVEDRKVRARLLDPNGSPEIGRLLAPWLKSGPPSAVGTR